MSQFSSRKVLRTIARSMLPKCRERRDAVLVDLGVSHFSADETSWCVAESAAIIRALVSENPAAARVPDRKLRSLVRDRPRIVSV
jgi:hypothetical protein